MFLLRFQLSATGADFLILPLIHLEFPASKWRIFWRNSSSIVLNSQQGKSTIEVWTKFNKFVISLDKKPNKWEKRVALFCAFLVDNNYQSSTIRSYVSAIKKFLREDGYDWNDNLVLLDVITKSSRLVNDRIKTRLPIQIGLLELLLFELQRVFENSSYYTVLMFRAVFLLA